MGIIKMENTSNADRARVTLNLMQEEYDNMKEGAHALQRTSENFEKTNRTYDKYTDGIEQSNPMIKAIQAHERWEERKLWLSYYAFMLSAAYIFLKRFYIFELVYYTLYAIIVTS